MIVDSMRRVVVLPAPLAPRRPKTSPSRQSKLTWSTARIFPRDSSRKVFVRSRTTTGLVPASGADDPGVSGECSARNGPTSSAPPEEPLADELKKCAVVVARDEVLVFDNRRRQLQCRGDADEFDGDGNRDWQPVVVSDDRLPEH